MIEVHIDFGVFADMRSTLPSQGPGRWQASALVCALAMCCGAPAQAEEGVTTLLDVPAMSLSALHSDLKFNLMAPARKGAEPAVEALQQQAQRVLGGLQASAYNLFPKAVARIGTFQVFVGDSRDISAMSSATGRIAINAGFADLAPTDDWLALVLAREMGHVISGHHDNNSTASILTSVLMNILVPGSSLIKSAASFAGSQLASSSGHERQLGEADGVALQLLEGAGYTARSLALNLALGPGEWRLGSTKWAEGFVASSRVIVARARPQPAIEAKREAPAPLVASSKGHLTNTATSSALEEIVMRRRPSGMPGPLLLGGHIVAPRLLEQ